MPAPKPTPIEIHKNRKIKSSGFFIAVLYLTIDRAPIKPKDSASDDLIMVIIKVTIIIKAAKLLEKDFFSDIVLEYFK